MSQRRARASTTPQPIRVLFFQTQISSFFVAVAHDFAAGISAVLFQDAGEVPSLELAKASDHGAGVVPTEVTADEDRVVRGIENALQRTHHRLLRERVQRGRP